jgi:beta-lactam-binding protein with PASTA domain
MKAKAAMIATCVSAAIGGGCGGTTTTTIETTVTERLPGTPGATSPPAGQAESGTGATPAETGQQSQGEVVPNELELRLNVAEEDLESKGFTYKVVGHGAFGAVAKANWTVCEMSPAPGAHVEKGTTIKLTIARFTKPRCKLLAPSRPH